MCEEGVRIRSEWGRGLYGEDGTLGGRMEIKQCGGSDTYVIVIYNH